MIGSERISNETPLMYLTVGELKSLFSELIPQPTKKEERNYVYGYKGIASIFNCSVCAAKRLKLSGKIDKAITQDGRKIKVDVDLALSQLRK